MGSNFCNCNSKNSEPKLETGVVNKKNNFYIIVWKIR